MNWSLLGFLAINLVFSTLSDTTAKMWALNPSHKWFWITLFINFFTLITFMLVIRQGGLAIGSTVALLLTIMTTVCIGYFIFKEPVTLGQWLGIGLGLCSAALILGLVKI